MDFTLFDLNGLRENERENFQIYVRGYREDLCLSYDRTCN